MLFEEEKRIAVRELQQKKMYYFILVEMYSWAQSEVEFFIHHVDSDAIHSERNLPECFENLKCLLDLCVPSVTVLEHLVP